jgi:hypothetical protein
MMMSELSSLREKGFHGGDGCVVVGELPLLALLLLDDKVMEVRLRAKRARGCAVVERGRVEDGVKMIEIRAMSIPA